MSVAVATADEVTELRARLAELEAAVAKLAGAAPVAEVLTPKQVAKRFAIDHRLVYDACGTGQLVAEKRPGAGRRACTWLIRVKDADRWYDRVSARRRNQ